MHRYAHINQIQRRARHSQRVSAAAKAQAFRELVGRLSSGDNFTARNRFRDAAKAGMRVADVVRFECAHDDGSTDSAYRDYLIGEATGTL